MTTNDLTPKCIEKKANGSNAELTALLEENRRLHKELAIAKEEKEILKNHLKLRSLPYKIKTLSCTHI